MSQAYEAVRGPTEYPYLISMLYQAKGLPSPAWGSFISSVKAIHSSETCLLPSWKWGLMEAKERATPSKRETVEFLHCQTKGPTNLAWKQDPSPLGLVLEAHFAAGKLDTLKGTFV